MRDDEILSYINSPNSLGAFLLSGGWGSGKTFFVRSIMKKHQSRKLKFCYLSLFGIKSIEQFHDAAREAYAGKLFSWNRIIGFLGIAAILGVFPQLGEWVGSLIGGESVASWASIISSILGLCLFARFHIKINRKISAKSRRATNVMIFDDLERCDLPMSTLLGLINEYVQDDIKTIIIANEDEILKNDADGNPLEQQGDKRVSYETFKEKVVGRTCEYKADVGYIVESMLGEFVTGLPKTDDFSNMFIKVFHNHCKGNFRTLRKIIIDFGSVWEILQYEIKTHGGEKQYVDLMEGFSEILDRLAYCVTYAVSLEHNNDKDRWLRLHILQLEYSPFYQCVVDGSWSAARNEIAVELLSILNRYKTSSSENRILRTNILNLDMDDATLASVLNKLFGAINDGSLACDSEQGEQIVLSCGDILHLESYQDMIDRYFPDLEVVRLDKDRAGYVIRQKATEDQRWLERRYSFYIRPKKSDDEEEMHSDLSIVLMGLSREISDDDISAQLDKLFYDRDIMALTNLQLDANTAKLGGRIFAERWNTTSNELCANIVWGLEEKRCQWSHTASAEFFEELKANISDSESHSVRNYWNAKLRKLIDVKLADL